MKILRRAAALLLAALTVLPLAACGKSGNENSAEGGTDKYVSTPFDRDYIERYGDTYAAEDWVSAYIHDAEIPPVWFSVDGKGSDEFRWEKKDFGSETYTDYAKTDKPVKRTVSSTEYTCAELGFKLVFSLTSYPGYPVVEYGAELVNTSGGNSKEISDLSCINSAIFPSMGKYTVHYNQGSKFNPNEYEPHTAVLDNKVFRAEALNGMATGELLPYFNVESEYGGGVIAAVNWQGNWFAEFSIESGAVRVKAGQNGVECILLADEHLKVPGAVLLFYKDGDWQYGQNVWRRWIIEHNLMRNTGRRDFTQNVFCCSGFPGAEQDLADIAAFTATGIPEKYNCTFELDAGWYGNSASDWWGSAGNWTPSEAYGNGGLKKLSDACHAAGMGFCIWIEPERLYSQTESAPVLGDNTIYVDSSGKYLKYADAKKDNVMGLINYGKQEAQDFVVNLVSGAVKEYGMDVYRQDFNTNNGQFWTAYDAYERKELGVKRSGVTENHACEGYIKAWTRIEEENPGLIFDACAGGGRRNDLETIRFSFMHTKSDYWSDVRSQQCQNFGADSWFIFTGTGFMDMSSMYDIRSRLTLSIGIGIAGADETLARALEEWASLQKYMYCDFYQLSGYTLDGSALAVQYHDHENSEGMAVVFLRDGGLYTAKAKGLDESAKYKVWNKDDPENHRVLTGETFMKKGIVAVGDGEEPSAQVFFYKKTDDSVTPFDYEQYVKEQTELIEGPEAELAVQTNDGNKISKLAAGLSVSDTGVQYVCADHDGSGGIYLIGDELYRAFVKTGNRENDGWTLLDQDKNYIQFKDEVRYPFAQWRPGTPFDFRGYVKRINGKCFLWLDNTFSFGDIDGHWVDDTRYVVAGDLVSEPFEFKVCSFTKIGGRYIQYVSFDKKQTGAVYICDEEVWESLPRGDETKDYMNIKWTAVQKRGVYFVRPIDAFGHNCDDESRYEKITLSALSKERGVELWLGENKKGKFILVENAMSSMKDVCSDRWQLYWPYEGTLRHVELLFVTTLAKRESDLPIPALIKF